ncbi:hypothetical protein [Rhodococcus sp. ARC_M5]|nr:hypothetical protein [Rhodococcus sp. ARC_M5]
MTIAPEGMPLIASSAAHTGRAATTGIQLTSTVVEKGLRTLDKAS